jgi:hypothetical protein
MAAPPPARKYFYTDANHKPSAYAVTLPELEELLAAGAVTQDTWTFEEGASNWVALKDLRSSARQSMTS